MTDEPIQPNQGEPASEGEEGAEAGENGGEGEEGEAAEAEEGEPTQEGEEGPAPEALSEQEINKRLTSLDKEHTRHEKRVTEIVGADVELLRTCPLCYGLTDGFVGLFPIEEERRAAAMIVLGLQAPRTLEADAHSSRCQVCNGAGLVLLDIQDRSKAEVICTDCGGVGAIGERFGARAPAAAVTGPTVETNGETALEDYGPLPKDVLDELQRRGFMAMPKPRA